MANQIITSDRLQIVSMDGKNYGDLTAKGVQEVIQKSKEVSKLIAGLPSPDSIEYYPISEKLREGETMKITYLARTIEESPNRNTGELEPLPTIIFIAEDGEFYKNSAFKLVKHFAAQKSGYQAEMRFKGIKTTKNGGNMQRLEFRPLRKKTA